MEIQKVFVNPAGDTAVLKCPYCGTARTPDVGRFKGSRRRIKVKCSCRSTFGVLFEFRKANRKDTNIVGHYAPLAQGEEWRKMLVTNISRCGIGLLAQSIHQLSEGDEIKVRFNLKDSLQRCIIEKEALVRWVEDIHIGCEFMASAGQDQEYDAALDSYLMPRAGLGFDMSGWRGQNIQRI